MALAGSMGAFVMAEYRAYVVGSDGHFRASVELICADDPEAKEKAKQLAEGYDVELWQLDRKIATFVKSGKSGP